MIEDIAECSIVHLISNDGGDHLYITAEDATADMAREEGYLVNDLPYYGSMRDKLASGLWKGDELLAAVNLKENILHHAIHLDAEYTTLIMIK